jgi:zinc protease
MPYRFRFVVLLLGLFVASSNASTAGPAPDAQSTLTQGILPNGLHYIILPRKSPKASVSLRLIVQAGSLDEHDDERGFAHFVEHMAFNGTKNFPPGTVRVFFETLGLTFGADLNANTGYTHTKYLLDLPSGKASHLDEALILLHNYADGQLFIPDEVRRESRVVISELNARDNAGKRISLDRLNTLFAGTLITNREVGGLSEQISSATAEQLRAFYRRNYSPARMTVVVVGPVDPALVGAKITELFGSMSAAAESLAPHASIAPPAEGIKPAVITVPTFTSTLTEFHFVAPRPPDNAEGRREELMQHLALQVFGRRLADKRERDLSHYSKPVIRADRPPFSPGFVHYSIELGTSAGDWSDAVQFIETELRRGREGFTQAEIDEAVAGELKSLSDRSSGMAGRSSASLANSLAGEIETGREWRSPFIVQAESQAILGGLKANDVTAAFNRIFPTDSFQLVLFVPPDTRVKPERLLSAYEKSSRRTLKKNSTQEEELHFRYENFGPAGRIVKQERVDDLNLTLLAFENGVRLNLRPSSFESGQFRLRIVFPYNLSDTPSDRPGIADLAGFLLLNSGLKKHKQAELSRLLRLHDVKSGFGVSMGTPMLTLTGPADELPFALQYLTALLSDHDYDDDYYRVALGNYGGMFQGMLNSAGGLAMRESLRVFSGDDRRTLLLNPRAFGNQDGLNETERWLRDHVLDGPLEVGLVGDFKTEAAIQNAAATIGTLRVREAAAKHGRPLTLPKKALRGESTEDIAASAAFSCALWPVTLPNDPRHNAALSLATDALQDQLLFVVREAVGATYSPQTRVHRDLIQPDFAYVSMVNTFDPASAQKYTEGCIRMAARMAEKGIGEDEFERIREPARTRNARQMRNNAWWLDNVVSLAQSRPEVLETARRHGKILDEVTLADVNEAAKVFKMDRITVIIVQPKSARPDGKAARKKK